MTVSFNRNYPPTAVPVVPLQEVCLIGSSRKDIVPHKLHNLMSVCRAHIVAATAQESFGCLCIIRPFQTVQLTDFNNPTIGYGFYLLLVTTGKRERVVKPFPADDLEKGAFPDTLRARQSQHVVKLATGGENPGNSRHEP